MMSPPVKCFIWELIDSQLLKHMHIWSLRRGRSRGGGNKVCIEEFFVLQALPLYFPYNSNCSQ